MMSGHLQVEFAPAEGALLRVLGIVERRGFSLLRVDMQQHEERGSLSMQVAGRDPSRRVDVLAAQLRRLHDVQSVSHSACQESHSDE